MPPTDETAATGGAETATNGAGGEAASMEDTARDTYRELMSTGDDEAPAGEEQTAEPSQASRARGADGKFTKAVVQAVADPQQPADPVAADPAAEAAAKPHDAFPNTWKRELGETWKALPEAVREEIHRREGDFHNGIRQYRDAANFGNGIAQEMLPYQQVMQQHGVQPRELVRDIMAALNTMATGTAEQKASTFLKLAGNYGISLDHLQTQRQRAPAGDDSPVLAPVLQRIRQVETRLETQQQEREQLQAEEDLATVQRFINDPKNEYAKEVQAEMSQLLTSGGARDLQEAYDKAIWVNPTVRAKVLGKQDEERVKRQAAEAAAARKAAGANVARRGTPPPAAQRPGTMEDTARSVYRDLVSSG